MLSVADTPEMCPSSLQDDSTAESHINTSHSSNTPQATADDALWTPVDLLLEEDDQFFGDQLPGFVHTAKLSPHANLFWHPRVQARLFALSDALFTSAVLAIAQDTCLGPNILFDPRLAPRIAAMGKTHFRGTFLVYAKRIPGFSEPEFKHHLREQAADVSTQERRHAILTSARSILAKEFAPLTFVVEDLLPAGCTLLVGKSKDGKSLMAYDIAVAVASGGKALGRYDVLAGSVWYLALEDGERRVQERLRMMEDRLETSLPDQALDKLKFTTRDAPRLGEGLEDDIRKWIETTPDARLLIIDILERIRPLRKPNANSYAEDYEPTATLARLAQDRNVAVLVVHHSNKANGEDFRDAPSGCMSLLGGADNLWVLRRQPLSEEATLNVTGRDIREPQQLPMQFRDGYWTVLEADAHRLATMSEARRDILRTIASSPTPLRPKEVAIRLGKNRNTTRGIMAKLVQQGALVAATADHYVLAPRYQHPLAPDRNPEPEAHTEALNTLNSPEPLPEAINTINTINTLNSVNTINSPEDIPAPPAVSPAPVYDEAPSCLRGVYGAVYGEDGTQVIDTPVDTAHVPQLFTVFTPPDAPATEAQGGANGHHNGTVSHGAAGVIDPVCPQCAKGACQPFGANGRVCMRCGYCERPHPA